MRKEVSRLLRFYVKKELVNVERMYGKVKVKGAAKTTLLRTLWAIGMLIVPFLLGLIMASVLVFLISAVILELILFLVMLFKGNSNIYTIEKMVRENPDVSIETLIKDNMEEETVLPKLKKISAMWCTLPVVTAFVMLVLVGGGFKTTVKYEEHPDGYEIVLYRQGFFNSTNIFEIPSEYNGKPVVGIREAAFRNNRRLKRVIIPDTVTTMGSVVFDGCYDLEIIELSENLTAMGGACFRNCKSLVEIELPDTLKELRGETFYKCKSLERVTLPKYITEIKGNTFEYCESLKSIDIPAGVTRIAAHSFYGCKSLSAVKVPASVKEIGSSAFRKCTSLDSIIVSKNMSIDERAFKESPTRIIYVDDLKAEEIVSNFKAEFEKIDSEVSTTVADVVRIEPVYVFCNIVNGTKIPDIYRTDRLVMFSETKRGSDYSMISTKKELLIFLKKAKVLGAEYVAMLLDNERIGESGATVGETYEIDKIIEAYSSDSWKYEYAYEKYKEKNKG